jgi:peptidoglycan-associated lipoprotein
MKTYLRFAALAGAVALAGCAGRKPARTGGKDAASAAAGAAAAAANAPEPDSRDLAVRAEPALKPVQFAYDSDRLDSAARFVLKANAGYLAANKAVKVQVAGHCDESGTVAYNLALGQRRARSVRDFYRFLGVDAGRVATISYGRERPLCSDATDSCLAVNRRAETLVLVDATLASSPRPSAVP